MAEEGRAETPARGAVPRWVKVLGVVALVVIVIVVVMLLVGGDHGPGRHT